MDKKNERKTVEVGRKRVPLKKLLHGKEIRVAAKALEDFRLQLVEQEFLLGAKITLHFDSYGDLTAVAKRPETDNEMFKRLEKARLVAEAKAERERNILIDLLNKRLSKKYLEEPWSAAETSITTRRA